MPDTALKYSKYLGELDNIPTPMESPFFGEETDDKQVNKQARLTYGYEKCYY